jgi:hypothetical protein
LLRAIERELEIDLRRSKLQAACGDLGFERDVVATALEQRAPRLCLGFGDLGPHAYLRERAARSQLRAHLGLELATKLRVHDEHLRDLHDVEREAPAVFPFADQRGQRRRDGIRERGLSLLDALSHRHVRGRRAQLAERDVGEQRRDSRGSTFAREVEARGDRDRIDDPVDDDALHAQRDAVAGLLGQLERRLLARCRHRDPGIPRPHERARARTEVS